MHTLKSWLLNSISRQVSILLTIILSIALILPAFYFYHSQYTELEKTSEQLAKQLITSLKTSISKSLLYNNNFDAWQIIKSQINNNKKQISAGGLLKISEIAILDKNNYIFAHSTPDTNTLQTPYKGILLDNDVMAKMGQDIILNKLNDNSRIRLYTNAIYQGNHSGLIILELNLSSLVEHNRKLITNFSLYFIITSLITILIGITFGKWISSPLNTIERSLVKIGSGKLNLDDLKHRHDEYKILALALENTDRELYSSKSQVDLLLDSTAEAIYGVDIDGNCSFVNKACLKILKYDNKSQLLGKNMYKALHDVTPDEIKRNNNFTLNLEEKIHIDNELIKRKDNTQFPAEYWSYPIYKYSECIGSVVTFIDISERFEALKALKEREQYLSLMLHSIGDAVIATDADGLITRMNPIAENLTGWTFQDAYRKEINSVFNIIDSASRLPIKNPVEKVLNKGEVVHLSNHTTLITKDGKEHHIADSAAPILDLDNNIQGMVLVFNDVTEQYTLRTQINAQKKKLQNVFDDMQSMVMILDTNGTITFINNTPLKLLNLSQQNVLGLKLWELNFFNYDTKIKNIVKTDCLTAATGDITFNDIEISYKKELYWIELSVHPVTNETGEIIQLVAEGRDINQRKQQEDILRRTQKMDAIGQLAGGIAHDFNNQLGVVIGYLDILQDSLSDKKQLKWIEKSSRATLRCIDLTRQLLAFSRTKSSSKQTVNINTHLHEFKIMIQRTVTPQIEVEYHLDNDLWLTDIDCNEFQDAILNLVINARDEMPNGGKLFFETSNKILDEGYATNKLDLKAGEYIQITLTDTGQGMDKKTLERLFEPFFTTKENNKGTGLGLTMVYSFIKRFNGGIRFYSEVGIGTSIHIYLPRSSSSILADNPKPTNLPLPSGNEKILVVDDELDLLDLASSYLTDLGYQVETAENANQAVDVLTQDDTINLVFSDIVMPGGMTGYELAEYISKQWPDIKILLTSGFTSRVKTSIKPAEFDNKLLNKPYRKTDLAKLIRLTLDETS